MKKVMFVFAVVVFFTACGSKSVEVKESNVDSISIDSIKVDTTK